MIFAKNFARDYEKKMLEKSDAWAMSHLSQQFRDPPYYIGDYRISGIIGQFRDHKFIVL